MDEVLHAALPEGRTESVREPGNVVVLTIGWTGSSVLTGLLRAAGFWAGHNTIRKRDYDTYENAELVRLDRALMDQAGVGEKYAAGFDARWLDEVPAVANSRDLSPYRAFVEDCERHAPWVWKDPRLWVTIRFWQPLLPPGRVKYILLTRRPIQAWTSCILRRQIQSYAFMRRYNGSIERSLREFLDAKREPYIHLFYDDLQLEPESVLERLSSFLDTPISMEHFRTTYAGPLYRQNHGVVDLLTAGMIYFKNYGERLR